MDHHSLSEHRRHKLEELAATRREHGQPAHQIAAEIAQTAKVTPLWAWRLAKGWRRSELLQRLRRLGDASVEDSMVWRWETGQRYPSSQHLDRLCQVYQTRPDLLGYGHDYSPAAPSLNSAVASEHPRVGEAVRAEPLAMVQTLTASGMSAETLAFLERSAELLQQACTDTASSEAALEEWARQYRAVRAALGQCQRVADRRRLARVAARLGTQLGVLLWELDELVAALAYFDASVVAAEEADDRVLGAWVAEHRASKTGGDAGR